MTIDVKPAAGRVKHYTVHRIKGIRHILKHWNVSEHQAHAFLASRQRVAYPIELIGKARSRTHSIYNINTGVKRLKDLEALYQTFGGRRPTAPEMVQAVTSLIEVKPRRLSWLRPALAVAQQTFNLPPIIVIADPIFSPVDPGNVSAFIGTGQFGGEPFMLLLQYMAAWQSLAQQYGGDWKQLAQRFGFANLDQAVTQLAAEAAQREAQRLADESARIFQDQQFFTSDPNALGFMDVLRALGLTALQAFAVLHDVGIAFGAVAAGHFILTGAVPALYLELLAAVASGSVFVTVVMGSMLTVVTFTGVAAILAGALLISVSIYHNVFHSDGPMPPGVSELPVTSVEVVNVPAPELAPVVLSPIDEDPPQAYESAPPGYYTEAYWDPYQQTWMLQYGASPYGAL